MKVILINPSDNLNNFLGRGKSFVPVFEPLGLLYIAAVCKKHGHAVRVIDAFAEKLSIDQLKAIILEEAPDVVGFSSFVSNGQVIYTLGRWLKDNLPKISVVLGNVHASVYAEAYLRNNCCDIVVHGEGEYTFLEILESLKNKERNFLNIHAISYLDGEKMITTSPAVVVEDLSQLPLPDRNALKRQLYNMPAVSNMPYSGKKSSIGKHMFTSRGCPFSCSFCVVHNKRGQRCNSVANVVDEMETLIKDYSAHYIFIMDPIFISNRNRTIEICREIKRRRLDFKWGCEGHVKFVDAELVKEMESAGCYDMAFGIESGVQRLLDSINKGTRLSEIEKAISIVKKNTRIKVSGLFILGLPGEKYEDSLATISFAKKLPLDMAQFSIFVPYPGSPIFYELRKRREIDTGLRDDGTLDTSVWLRYSSYISYTHSDPIWVTPGLTAATLKKLQKKAFREFYFRPKQFLFQLKKITPANLLKLVLAGKDTFF